jgi:hypothetical protein
VGAVVQLDQLAVQDQKVTLDMQLLLGQLDLLEGLDQLDQLDQQDLKVSPHSFTV